MNTPILSETKKSISNMAAFQQEPVLGRKLTMGHILLEMGKITAKEAEHVLRLQKESGMRFGDAALHLGLVTEADIQQVLAHQFDYPYLLPEQGGYPQELVVAYQPFCAQVEVFRAVRSQLMVRWFSDSIKALTVVSTNLGEETSLFAANLAVVFSQLGERTLLIDANLRTPHQHKIFNLENKQGLSDFLAGRASIIDVISKIESFVDLSVLPAGTLPPNPLELLSRDPFRELNKNLASQFDVILYDTSDFLIGSDALAIAAHTGGALLVANKHNTRLADIQAMNEQIIRSNVEVVGSVMVDS